MTFQRQCLAIGVALACTLPAGAAEEQAAAYDALQERIIEVSQRVKPSVVHIDAIVKVNDRRNQVEGSGVIASAEGLILTNHHVVEKAQKVEVTVPGRKQKYSAQILGTDKQTDIAVLKIEPEGELIPATFGDASQLHVGQWVLAIGNPYGLDGTVSFGIVSAKGRNLEVRDLINDFIQTDAMIDRGSSGGPLIDLEGNVVGINSRGQGRGIGFTIPIDTALDVMRQIEEGGIARGWLGVTMQPLDRDLANYFEIPNETGVIVNSVSKKSPAERGGLRTGDVVTAFDGVRVEAEKEEDLGDFQRLVAQKQPGTQVEVAVLRDGKQRTLKLEIGTQPKVEPSEEESDMGFHVQEITEKLYRTHRLNSKVGAYVSFVARGSPAAEAGLVPGDVVQSIGKKAVKDLKSFLDAIGSVDENARVLITTRRGDETKYVLVKRDQAEESEAANAAPTSDVQD